LIHCSQSFPTVIPMKENAEGKIFVNRRLDLTRKFVRQEVHFVSLVDIRTNCTYGIIKDFNFF
jgi:hypothetical protein